MRDPYKPTVCGLGYLGEGIHLVSVNSKHTKAYSAWIGMLGRCYRGIYTGITVNPDWLNFQNFAQWHVDNYKEGFDLDKDILIPDNTEYSSDACVYIPTSLNAIASNRPTKLLPGVRFRWNKYHADIQINGKKEHIGKFATEMEAYHAYKERKIKVVTDTLNGHVSSGDISTHTATCFLNYFLRLLP